MQVPIHFVCKCGQAGGILVDDQNPPSGVIAVGDCKPKCAYSIFVSVNSIDTKNKLLDYTVSIKLNEPADY